MGFSSYSLGLGIDSSEKQLQINERKRTKLWKAFSVAITLFQHHIIVKIELNMTNFWNVFLHESVIRKAIITRYLQTTSRCFQFRTVSRGHALFADGVFVVYIYRQTLVSYLACFLKTHVLLHTKSNWVLSPKNTIKEVYTNYIYNYVIFIQFTSHWDISVEFLNFSFSFRINM